MISQPMGRRPFISRAWLRVFAAAVGGCSSALPLREGKGTAFEGGARVPCIMRWPGRIEAGAVSRSIAGTIDILPTICAVTGAPLPEKKIDGVSVS